MKNTDCNKTTPEFDATQDIIEHHFDRTGGFFTTPLFWDCECDEEYIHPRSQPDCPVCGVCHQDAADSRVDEVLRHAVEWQLDPDLTRRVDEALACANHEDEPDEGPLVEQYENASRMYDDDWLETAYEDGVSGWGDEF